MKKKHHQQKTRNRAEGKVPAHNSIGVIERLRSFFSRKHGKEELQEERKEARQALETSIQKRFEDRKREKESEKGAATQKTGFFSKLVSRLRKGKQVAEEKKESSSVTVAPEQESKAIKKDQKQLDKEKDSKKKEGASFISKMKGLFIRKEKSGPSHEFFEKKLDSIKKKRPLIQERRFKLRFYLDRAGITTPPGKISQRIFDVSILLNILLSGGMIYSLSTGRGYTITDIIISFTFIWTVVFGALIMILWALFYIILDLKIYNRKVEIEEVLPDYLQLTASNIKAGMTVDRALWYAVRPRFGVLANEIEVVAKETMRGEDLKDALQKFADKYDSAMLKRSISLLIEGIESGGEIGYLLNKIAINIQENKIMKREMAANVSTYVIFISFATVAAAPALFALSGVLIRVIASLGSSLGTATESASSFGFMISFSGSGIHYGDFKIFAIVSLIVSSFFSSMIIATIMKGSARAGLKYIPIFIILTVTIFLAADMLLGGLVGFVI